MKERFDSEPNAKVYPVLAIRKAFLHGSPELPAIALAQARPAG